MRICAHVFSNDWLQIMQELQQIVNAHVPTCVHPYTYVHMGSLGPCGPPSVLVGPTGPLRAALGPNGPPWALVGPPGLCWVSLRPCGPSWALVGLCIND